MNTILVTCCQNCPFFSHFWGAEEGVVRECNLDEDISLELWDVTNTPPNCKLLKGAQIVKHEEQE